MFVGNVFLAWSKEVEDPNSFLQTLDNTIFRNIPLYIPEYLDDVLLSDPAFTVIGICYACMLPSFVGVPFTFPDIEDGCHFPSLLSSCLGGL